MKPEEEAKNKGNHRRAVWQRAKGYKYGRVVKHNGRTWVACFPGRDGLVWGEPGKTYRWEEF